MTREIPLTRGYVAIVDDEDYERVASFKWQVSERRLPSGKTSTYAQRSEQRAGKCKTIYMHRFVIAYNGPLTVDHKDGNGLNNTRSNLRVCNTSKNAVNRDYKSSSGYRGVYFEKDKNKYSAQITYNYGNCKRLGLFDDPKAAARAYDFAARQLHGDFARLNFPEAP